MEKKGIDYSFMRGKSSDAPLKAATLEWLGSLPAGLRPKSLPLAYPRIANSLRDCWDKPKACLAYFEDLLIDGRGDRMGFPGEIALEIAALKDFYETHVFITSQTTWEHIIAQNNASA
jgi:hypothetical protein